MSLSILFLCNNIMLSINRISLLLIYKDVNANEYWKNVKSIKYFGPDIHLFHALTINTENQLGRILKKHKKQFICQRCRPTSQNTGKA